MVGFDIPFAFVASGALSWRAQGKRPELPLLYAGAGIAPPGVVYLAKYPDWDWQYLVDPTTVPLWAPAAFLTAIMIAAYAGLKAGSCCPKWVAIGAGLLGIFLLATLDRTLHLGTYAQYHAGEAPLADLSFLTFGIPWFLWSGLVAGYCIYRGEQARGASA